MSFLSYIPSNGSNQQTIINERKDKAVKEWTLMLYFCADTRSELVTPSIDNSGNFLHAALTEAKMKLQTMDLLPGSITDFNVIVLYDYPYTFQEPNGHAVIYQLRTTADGGNTQEAAWGPVNMGHPDTLSDFIVFCKTNFPANNYALVLSDHGRGYAGYCFDYHAPHPYWPYALGDSLSVPELETALSGSNYVDVLIFNTCLGGSFETAWQLVGEVSFIVAGETIQSSDTLHHPREVAYALSRDTSMTPKELAEAAFNSAVYPVALSFSYFWGSVSLYDLTKFDFSIGVPSFMDTFDQFTEKLVAEIYYNTSMIPYLRNFRGNMTTYRLDSSESMMVDLYDFLENVVANETDFHYTETGTLANELVNFLEKNPTGILVNESHTSYHGDHLHGFNICFPDSFDMYRGFLYPNLYEDFKISTESHWWEFIKALYPLVSFDKFKLKDFYEFQLFIIDPSIRLDIFYNPLETPDGELHVGLNDDFADVNMGIELGIEGAEYHEDLLGNVMIRIPTASVRLSKATDATIFRVVINATSAASASQDVNLTVKHVMNNEVVWQESQQSEIEIGQQVSCDVSTDDEITDFEVEQIWTNISENTAFIGPKKALTLSTIAFTMTIIIAIVYRKIFQTKKG